MLIANVLGNACNHLWTLSEDGTLGLNYILEVRISLRWTALFAVLKTIERVHTPRIINQPYIQDEPTFSGLVLGKELFAQIS